MEHLVLTWADEVRDDAACGSICSIPGAVATRLRLAAFPGEVPDSLPRPEDVAPALAALCLPSETRNGEIVALPLTPSPTPSRKGRGAAWSPPSPLREGAGRRPSARPPHAVVRDRLCRGGHRAGGFRRHRPAADLVPEDQRLDAAASDGLSGDLQPAVGHQAGLRHRVGLRAAVRLPAEIVSADRLDRRGGGLCLRRAARRSWSDRAVPVVDRLCDGDRKHDVRGVAGGERPALRRQRALREPAMAVVQRRHPALGRRRRANWSSI